jgi:hypothetical protein
MTFSAIKETLWWRNSPAETAAPRSDIPWIEVILGREFASMVATFFTRAIPSSSVLWQLPDPDGPPRATRVHD